MTPPLAAWLLLALLTFLNGLNFVDRQLLPMLAPLIIADLGLSRAEIGLLIGFAFVLIYAVAGLALGVAGDRWPRRGLVAAGLALWSVMTAVTGAAGSFVQVAMPRFFVGVGEAALTPSALSMLGDVFPARQLGLATSIYYAGLPVGTAASLVVAGWMAPRFGWRACFYVLGLVGLVAGAGLFAVREPRRRAAPAARSRETPTLAGLWREATGAVRTKPALALVMVGGAALSYGSASALHGITWIVQERGFAYATAAYTAGAMSVAGGLAGSALGAWLSDWCGARWAGGRSWSLVLITIFFAPFNLGFFTLPAGSPLFYGCWFLNAASQGAWAGPVYAALQDLAPDRVRSSVLAVGLLVVNVLGVGPGPWVTGLIGDRHSLTLGLVVSVAVGLSAVAPFSLAARAEARGAMPCRSTT